MKYNIGNPYQSQQIAVNTPQLNQGSQLAKQLASGIAGAAGSAAGGPLGAIAAQAGVNLFSNLFEYGLNSYQAQKNRDFQASMSNTSYQRAVKDMLAAGLNPSLMFRSGQGASTPSGATASMHSNPTNLSELLLYKAQLDQIRSSARLSNANANLAEEEAEGKAIENQNKQDVIDAELAYKEALAKLTDKQREQVDYNIKQIIKNNELTDQQINQVKAAVAKLAAETEILSKQSDYYTWSLAKIYPISEDTARSVTSSSQYAEIVRDRNFNVGATVTVKGEVKAEAGAGKKGIAHAEVSKSVGGEASVEGGYSQGKTSKSGSSEDELMEITLKNTDLLMLIPQKRGEKNGYLIGTWLIRGESTYQIFKDDPLYEDE